METRSAHLPLDVVTGAFGYIGRYIARRLLGERRSVRTLTGRPQRPNPFGDRIEVARLDFQKPERLAESLRGARTLYNTYWIRFPRGRTRFDTAVDNSRTLLRAAEQAGVQRVVHISVTNPSERSVLAYFRGKAAVARLLVESGLSHTILRPTLVFGKEDVLINNIAWLLRRFPVFLIPGAGDYRVQPVFVEDLAELAVTAARRTDSSTFDAVGPEVLTFDGLVRAIAGAVGSRARILHTPPSVALGAARIIGTVMQDVILTREEMEGLRAELLVSPGPPTARTPLTEWLSQNAGTLGTEYTSELARHYR